MVEEFGLRGFEALGRLAVIVRGADTAHPEIAPQAAGLLAASLGLSRMYADDLEQLEAGMLIYDAFYRWCRDAVDETHDWVSHKPRRVAKQSPHEWRKQRAKPRGDLRALPPFRPARLGRAGRADRDDQARAGRGREMG